MESRGSGLDWPSAVATVQSGLLIAQSFGVSELWIAEGTYEIALSVPSGWRLYGGFAGTETDSAQRDIARHATILDASTAKRGGPADHVVEMIDVSASRLDGFTLTGGFSDRSRDGGALYVRNANQECVVANCTIDGNTARVDGGGVFCTGNSLLLFENCTIQNNVSGRYGGGISCSRDASPRFVNCLVAHNEASSPPFNGTGWGGGIHLSTSATTIVNCTVVGNKSQKGGGVTTDRNSAATIVNTIIADNAPYGFYGSPASLTRTLFHLNQSGDYFDNNAQLAYTGAYQIDANVAEASDNFSGDPLFRDAGSGDFRLRDGSRALDRGDPAAAPTIDFEGDARPGEDGLVDIGVDEAEGALEPDSLPQSTVLPLPVVSFLRDFDIPWNLEWVDESGLSGVELYYRRDRGPWTLFPGSFEISPILFSTSSTGGDGYYEFSTVVTDNDGHKELIADEADAMTIVSTDFTSPRIYVDQDAPGSYSGDSWAEALPTIASALQIAHAHGVVEVWVAQGVYEESIQLNDFVSLYGGFAGTESNLEERDFNRFPTTIDASRADNGAQAEHVVSIEDVNQVRLDGFVITGGGGGRGRGGGLLMTRLGDSVVIANCVITNNSSRYGGGISCQSASPVIRNCTIAHNNSFRSGAGMSCTDDSSPIVSNSLFSSNSTDWPGGGVYLENSTIRVTNCQFVDNFSLAGGGGINVGPGSHAEIENCLFARNDSLRGGGLLCVGSASVIQCTFVENTPTLSHLLGGGAIRVAAEQTVNVISSIFYANLNSAIAGDEHFLQSLRNCLFHENTDGDYRVGDVTFTGAEEINTRAEASGNLDGDPLFFAAEKGYYQLTPGSPAINAAWPDIAMATDIRGIARM